MSLRRKLDFVFCLVVLIGCAGIVSENDSVRFIETKEKSPRSVFDQQELSKYGAYLASLDDEERMQECQKIGKQDALAENPIARLQYAMALMVTRGCGELQDALDILRSYPADTKAVSRQLQFRAATVERMLKEVDEKQKRESEVEEMTKSKALLRSQLDANEAKLQTARSELKTLQSKLDAIKSIEKSINQRNGNPIQ